MVYIMQVEGGRGCLPLLYVTKMQFWALAFVSAFVGVVAASPTYEHVALFSIDGFHGSDVAKYVAKRPDSTLAKLLSTGYEYTNAFTSAPSDSFPGSQIQFTGATPRTTGVWYDDTYDRTFFARGSNCTGPPGAEGTSRDPKMATET
jgi:Type I phosphodiesterase / nucleotide pyrophosphatase